MSDKEYQRVDRRLIQKSLVTHGPSEELCLADVVRVKSMGFPISLLISLTVYV